jgi:radical SAM-linked protein
MAEDKTRFRFRKDAALRLLSHHDLARAFERLLRRSQLPFASTGGFHPGPRLVFALSLPLGAVGANEVVEIEWTSAQEPELAFQKLQEQCPPGLTLLSAKRIPVKQTARVACAHYELPVPADRQADVFHAIEALCERKEIIVDRERPRPKRIDVFAYVESLKCEAGLLRVGLYVTQNGTAKADEIARALDLGDMLDDGACWTRADLIVRDELPLGLAQSYPENLEIREWPRTMQAPAAPVPVVREAAWGASPHGPIVE